MTKRRRLTEREVLLVCLQQGATIPCRRCDKPIDWRGAIESERDHVLALGLGGKDTLDNVEFLHRRCHKAKTDEDKERIAKADRQRRHHETGRSSGKARVQKIPARVDPWPKGQKIAKRVDPWGKRRRETEHERAGRVTRPESIGAPGPHWRPHGVGNMDDQS